MYMVYEAFLERRGIILRHSDKNRERWAGKSEIERRKNVC